MAKDKADKQTWLKIESNSEESLNITGIIDIIGMFK